MGAGLGLLRLSPADFWAMTPRELGAALKVIFGEMWSEPPERDALMALMARYPDKKDTRHGRSGGSRRPGRGRPG